MIERFRLFLHIFFNFMHRPRIIAYDIRATGYAVNHALHIDIFADM